MTQAAIDAVKAAVAADPSNAELRLALAELLDAAGQRAEAITEAATVLAARPGDARAMSIVVGTLQGQTGGIPEAATPADEMPPADAAPPVVDVAPPVEATRIEAPDEVKTEDPHGVESNVGESDAVLPPVNRRPGRARHREGVDEPAQTSRHFDWDEAEKSFDDAVPPPFVESEERIRVGEGAGAEGVAPLEPALPKVTFEDVGGLENVKTRLNESFIQPMRHAEIAQAFGKSLRGGLLLYGPPGCGKTFMARAVAGELGAGFMSLVMTDVIGSFHGETEKNIHAVFQEARKNDGPTVLFLDEIDALALKRSSLTSGSTWLRSTVNQLLLEMDSMQGENDGLYVLAATNHPWDLDEAVLRPGRLDRAVLVSPPDLAAREAILRRQLERRPVAGIDLGALAQSTTGFSGADLEHLCVTAAEKAMMRSIDNGEVQPITMTDLAAALREVQPSTSEWLQSARNVVRFAADGGRYDDLRDYLNADGQQGKGGRRKGWWS